MDRVLFIGRNIRYLIRNFLNSPLIFECYPFCCPSRGFILTNRVTAWFNLKFFMYFLLYQVIETSNLFFIFFSFQVAPLNKHDTSLINDSLSQKVVWTKIIWKYEKYNMLLPRRISLTILILNTLLPLYLCHCLQRLFKRQLLTFIVLFLW